MTIHRERVATVFAVQKSNALIGVSRIIGTVIILRGGACGLQRFIRLPKYVAHRAPNVRNLHGLGGGGAGDGVVRRRDGREGTDRLQLKKLLNPAGRRKTVQVLDDRPG